jgi:hypothetical protein
MASETQVCTYVLNIGTKNRQLHREKIWYKLQLDDGEKMTVNR